FLECMLPFAVPFFSIRSTALNIKILYLTTLFRSELDTYETRLEELAKMRYDQTSISDPEIVSAYDFASNSLVTELVAVAESQTQFTYNSTLQKMVESIRSADL